MIKKHLHTYTRVKHKTRRDLYKCRDPYCTFRGSAMWIEGRAALCVYCGKEYIVTKEALRLRNPHCAVCTEPTSFKKHSDAAIEKIAKQIETPFNILFPTGEDQ